MAQPHDPYATPEERRALRRAEKAARARQAQDDSVLQSIMSRDAGRAWMYALLGECRIFHTVAHTNPHFTYLNEGKRQIGLMLLTGLMTACPEAYIRMLQESADGGRIDSTNPTPVDRTDRDDERNYDSADRWIGDPSADPANDPD